MKWTSRIIALLTIITFTTQAQDSGGIAYPGNGLDIMHRHSYIPADMGWAIQGVIQAPVDHVGYTVTEDGVEGVRHCDGMANARFTSWTDYQALIKDGQYKTTRKNWLKVAYRGIKALTCDLYEPGLGETLAVALFQYVAFPEALKARGGITYDFTFMSPDNDYCSNHLKRAWDSISIGDNPYEEIRADAMPGWDVFAFEGVTFGMLFMSGGMSPATMVVEPVVTLRDPETFERIHDTYEGE